MSEHQLRVRNNCVATSVLQVVTIEHSRLHNFPTFLQISAEFLRHFQQVEKSGDHIRIVNTIGEK